MTWTILKRAAAVICVAFATACNALDVDDPTAILDDELNDAAGAELLRGDALSSFYIANGESALYSGALADEFFANTPDYYPSNTWDVEQLDRRSPLVFRSDVYEYWMGVRRAATGAVSKLLTYGSKPHAAELYAVRALATIRLGEDFCPGFPLHEQVDLKVIYGRPLSTDEVFERALVDLDSASANVGDSTRVVNVMQVIRGRVLLDLGRYAEAAAAATTVPTSFAWNGLFRDDTWSNPLAVGFYNNRSYGISDVEGGTGLDFASAADPRLETDSLDMAADGITKIIAPSKYVSFESPVVVASGIEARLVEAEAAFNTGGDWRQILNQLRATVAMDSLIDPGTDAARVDLIFRERAFWLFGTGHRLGDLRRLVSQYGRAAESVFPTGNYRLGGPYQSVTNLAFDPTPEAPFSPAVTGCTSR